MTNYQIKAKNSDFRVTEIADLDLSGGAYSVFYLNKSGMKTMDAVDHISRMTGIAVSEISYSGLKDEDAVTGQYISVLNAGFEKLSFSDDRGNYFTINYIGNSPEQNKIGKLLGNAFCIRIRNLDMNVAQRIAADEKKLINTINYYGIQRFGMPDLPKITHLIGKSFLDEQYNKMAEFLHCSGNISDDEYDAFIKDPLKMLRGTDIRRLNFYLSAWDSYIWNNTIADSVSSYNEHTETREISGIKYIYSYISADTIEALSEFSITRHRLMPDLSKEEYISYRQPILPVVYHCSDIMPDELNRGKFMIDLKFTLPSGSYATMAIDQILWKYSS